MVPTHLFTEPLQFRSVGTVYGTGACVGEYALTASLEQGLLLQGVGMFVSADAGIAKLFAGFVPKVGMKPRILGLSIWVGFCYVLGRSNCAFWGP